jgi:DNA-damage-inducible protein D
MENQLAIFEQKPIRRIEFEGDMWFSVVDIIEILTNSANPSVYWSAVKKRESESFTFCKRFNFARANGKNYPTDCANTEGVLRIIMSVPSPQAEPLKLWLAETGKQAIIETQNPELGIERMTEIYKAKGYSTEWVGHRLKTIEVRKELTDTWKERGIKDSKDYSILTATIAKGTFGLNPSEHKTLKGLKKPSQELRDHMTPLELIFTALSEETTRLFVVNDDAQGFNENHEAAQKGGHAMGKARQNYEKETGFKVVSPDNFLGLNAPQTPELKEKKKED